MAGIVAIWEASGRSGRFFPPTRSGEFCGLQREDAEAGPVDATFDAEVFNPGSVYFLNSQKLSVAGLLTNKEKGDLRNFTIWETINNTIRRPKSRFYAVIDEAHRGMRRTANEQAQAKSTIQKFIFGVPGEVDPSRVVIGVSATPERFDALLQGASRTRRSVDIPANEPRAEGLIKDFILMCHKDDDHPTEWTLLAGACQEFDRISTEWRAYCIANNEQDIVRPVLLIQVEDAAGHGADTASRTSLEKVVAVIKANTTGLVQTNFAHCLQSGATIQAGGMYIRYVEPHRIEHDATVRVVIFKMALTTGWDCPRAEVMMSFRRADDATYIAQLVGRIVRTPLTRRMEGNDLLNSVMLFLPFFNRAELEAVVVKLQGDGGESKGADAGDKEQFQTLTIAKGKEDLLDVYRMLPTYTSQEGRKVPDIRRAQRLAAELAFDEWPEENLAIRNGLNTKLLDVGTQRRKDAGFVEMVEGFLTVSYRMLRVENGVFKPDDPGEQKTLRVTEQDVETVFSRSFVTLTEDLAWAYVRARYDADDPNADYWRCKLEVFLLSQDESVVTAIEAEAQKLVEQSYDRKKQDINKLPPERQAAYKRIVQISRHFEATEPSIPNPLRLRTDSDSVPLADHLFVNDDGEFKAALNTWEAPVLSAAQAAIGFVGWLRNYPRKPWSIGFTYELGGISTPGYPDFVVFRKEGKHIVVDLLEPHQGSDSLAKAHGLCKFAAAHGEKFGHIEWIKVEGSQIIRLNLNSASVRQKVQATKVDGALETLFTSLGSIENVP